MPDPYEYRDALPHGLYKGRGAGLNPGNRHETVRLHVLGEHLDEVAAERGEEAVTIGEGQTRTQVFPDKTRTLINKVSSPDMPMGWTVNPYRGCEHGCVYCYARPDHERLGMSLGLDFETKIMAKFDAPKILRRELANPRWKGEGIMMAGVTDCYQPIERELRITRGCLEVMAECRQPVTIVTKNRLVLRDLDLLREMAACGVVTVGVSVTSLDASLALKMEPRASSPSDRLHTIRELANAGVPVMAMVAPIVPGITDHETPMILKAVAEAGARSAGYVLLRLPYQLKDLYLDWLKRHFAGRAAHAESLLRQTHDGALYDATPGKRRRGEGPIAEHIGRTFEVFKRRYGLDRGLGARERQPFRPPRVEADGQMRLF
ncbi:MAG: PA0069 family radical SAM protein [Planctomycetes bacterium]|nr:PA0069 family radical SAM protein [Planctomycetota bacterium]